MLAAQAYADKLGLIPSDITTGMILLGLDKALATISTYQKKLKTLHIPYLQLPAGVTGSGVLKPGATNGGIIPGPPSSKDNIIMPMATGEGVATADAMLSTANRAALNYMNAGGNLDTWRLAAPSADPVRQWARRRPLIPIRGVR
ncbi:MAG: hypothetical protein JWQ39_1965 [Glaciihabitans sp.]|nr:hypothetical protein [Glaciihabitans sp.]